MADPLRRTIAARVRAMVGSGEVDLARPAGDPGLFGPGSIAWRVHGDFTSMLVGGVAALLLQTLHPAALAGVWDHSDFRRDRGGRLKRTAQFVAATTFGSTALATRMIDTVRRIHDRVHGVLPDGTPYSANDPALLTWVHAAEMSSFLAAHLRYRDPGLPAAAQDRYLAETATIAERLGATGVPRSRRELEAYFRAVRPQLRCDARTAEVAAILLSPAAGGATGRMEGLVREAGLDLLPGWALALHGRALSQPRRAMVRAGVRGTGGVLRWALAA